MSQFRQYYGDKHHYTPQITLERYATRQVKGNGNIRAFLGMLMVVTVICAVCALLV